MQRSSRLQQLKRTTRRRMSRLAFTLIELLVVIGIIALLAGLIVPAVITGIGRTQVASVTTEITELDRALLAFKEKYGIFPPSWIRISEAGGGWGTATPVEKRSVALMRQMFGRSFDFSANRDFNGDGDSTDTFVLTGDEALVFFLGGPRDFGGETALAGFSKNPKDPFAQGGSSRESFFEFDNSRLRDVDGDGMFSYVDSLPSQTRPYLYLSNYTGTGYDASESAIDVPNTSVPGTPELTSVYLQTAGGKAINEKSYQLISPGFDFDYGVGGVWSKSSASSDLADAGRLPERDNITNFSGGTLAAD